MSTVLIVDDEPDALFLLSLVFRSAGYEVEEADHGGSAVARIGERRPDLVVTDLMMPVLDGAGLIHRLRADPLTRDIPIVLVTATPDSRTRADAVVAKPFAPDTLVTLADRLVRDRGARRGGASGPEGSC